MGPVISAGQQERVLGFLERVRAGGAEVRCGGVAGSPTGFFVQPTVVSRVGQRDEIVQREVFAPSSPSTAWPTPSRPSRWPTRSSTASPPRCGRAM
jgi:acyl-CoA reductase-like NAD-dependent aldehyde dehydrogenase